MCVPLPSGAFSQLETLELQFALLHETPLFEPIEEGQDALTALSTAISQGTALQRLRTISLRHCMHYEDAMQVLLVGLSKLPELTNIHMAVHVDDDFANALAHAIAPLPPGLGAAPPFQRLEVLEVSEMSNLEFEALVQAMGSDRFLHGLPALTRLKVCPGSADWPSSVDLLSGYQKHRLAFGLL